MFLRFLYLVVINTPIFCSIWEDEFTPNPFVTDKHPQRSRVRGSSEISEELHV